MSSFDVLYGPASIGKFDGVASLDINRHDLKVGNNYEAMVFCVEKSQQITDIGLYVVCVSGTTSAYVMELTTLDSAGNPANTFYGGGSGSVYFANQFASGWNWMALEVPGTGTAGDFCSARIRVITGSVTNFIATCGVTIHKSSLPRLRTQSTTTLEHPIMAIRYADGSIQGLSLSGMDLADFDDSSSPDDVGAKFTLPVEMVCNGVHLQTISGGPYQIILFDESNNILRTTSVPDVDYVAGAEAAFGVDLKWDEITLVRNQTYRLILHPTSSSNVFLNSSQFPFESYRYVVPNGLDWQKTERTNSGSWSDTSTQVPWMALRITSVTVSTGTTTVSSSEAGSYYGWAG